MVISLSLHLNFTFWRKTVGKKIMKFRRSSSLIGQRLFQPILKCKTGYSLGEGCYMQTQVRIFSATE